MIPNPTAAERARQDLPLLTTLEDAALLAHRVASILIDVPDARAPRLPGPNPLQPREDTPADPSLFLDCIRLRDRISALIVRRDERAAELAERDARAAREVAR